MLGNLIELRPIISVKHFNEELAKNLSLYRGKKDHSDRDLPETFSVHAFVVFGEEIIFALKEKVKTVLEGDVTKEAGDDLLRQFDSFCELVKKVKAVAADFRGKLLVYNRETDAEVRGSFVVMNYDGAEKMTETLLQFVTTIEYKYLSPGGSYWGFKTSTTLIDRIDKLRGLIS